jgi:uncharacterized protein (TIGR00730 family)
MKSIAVFCGSREGYSEVYREAAYAVGAFLADAGIGVVYGGGKIGLMGALADGVLQNNGQITGVIPSFLQTKEVAHDGLSDMIITNTMHERKVKMYELCDAVIVLPGGWGTMDEMFEMLTWGQLGLHQKPIGLFNVNGYYESLKVLVNSMVQEGFLDEQLASMLLSGDTIDELLELMRNYEAPQADKLINKAST